MTTEVQAIQYAKNKYDRVWRQMIFVFWFAKCYPVGFPEDLVKFLESKRRTEGLDWLKDLE